MIVIMTIKKSKPQQPPQEPSYKLGMGSTPRPTDSGGFIGTTIPVKHSERRPLSLEEAGRPTGKDSDFLYGIPGASIIKSRERRFDTQGGWYDT